MDRIEYFAFLKINLYVQNVYGERFLSVWFYLAYRSKSYFIMLHECCIYCTYIYIYHYGRWLAVIVNKS